MLVFTHQDITLKTPSELRKFAEYIEQFETGDIIGAAGVKYGGEKVYGNLTDGKDYTDERTDEIIEPINVFSLDEVFIGMKRETFEMYHFNEKACDNWHLYAVEICLHAISEGHKNYVVPVNIHHYSWGSINTNFYKTEINLIKFYRNHFKTIWSTCYETKTNWIAILKLKYKYWFSKIFKKF